MLNNTDSVPVLLTSTEILSAQRGGSSVTAEIALHARQRARPLRVLRRNRSASAHGDPAARVRENQQPDLPDRFQRRAGKAVRSGREKRPRRTRKIHPPEQLITPTTPTAPEREIPLRRIFVYLQKFRSMLYYTN